MPWSWEVSSPEDRATSISLHGVPWATLTPLSPSFAAEPVAVVAGRAYVLSRFAYTRAEAGDVLLESPRTQARVVLHDWRAAAIVHLLARPRSAEAIGAEVAVVPVDAISALIGLLLQAAIAFPATADGDVAGERGSSLRSWEFHDLLFHARSRGGRHDQPTGATYRFLGGLDPAPPLPAVPHEGSVALYRPELERLMNEDPPLARVQEARRSIRDYGARPLGARAR